MPQIDHPKKKTQYLMNTLYIATILSILFYSRMLNNSPPTIVWEGNGILYPLVGQLVLKVMNKQWTSPPIEMLEPRCLVRELWHTDHPTNHPTNQPKKKWPTNKQTDIMAHRECNTNYQHLVVEIQNVLQLYFLSHFLILQYCGEKRGNYIRKP